MNIVMAIVLGVPGLLIGWFIPTAAQKATEYKFKKLHKELARDPRYALPIFKACMAVLNGGGWAVVGLFASKPLSAVLLGLIWVLAILIAVVDIRIRIIPNEGVLILAPLGLLFQFTYFGVTGVITAVITMVAVMLVLSVLAGLMGPSAVGAGDVKLAGAMGLVLGFPNILYGLFAMSAVMLVYIVAGLLSKKLTFKSFFPFAPFMMTGLAAAVIVVITR